jgi:diguanylate cyclase (GGDEF)-like protein
LSGDERRDLTSGEVLVAHAPSRILSAIAIGLLQAILVSQLRPVREAAAIIASLTAVVAVYLVVVFAVRRLVERRERASPALVSLILVADLAGIFAATGLATTPEHYERALFGTIVIVLVAIFFFGRRQAWLVVQLGVVGHLLLVATALARGLRVDVGEELWSLSLCAAGLVFIVLQASDVRRRLRTIVRLFERAEDGDFSHEYDTAADGRPDAITRVGQAYNGVRAQLSNLVLTDPLTGCQNRRGFDQALIREVSRATRSGSEFALLALDLDHFKLVNDTYGHIAGDIVLREIGALLLHGSRAGDVFARVGGEEFAILLADTGVDGAHLFASRLCERIRSHPFVLALGAETVTITTSIGIASGTPRGVSDFPGQLWSRADSALYAAKRAGRNCVFVWTTELELSGEHTVRTTPPSLSAIVP